MRKSIQFKHLKLSPLFLALFVGVNSFADTKTDDTELDEINVTTDSDSTTTEHSKAYTTSAMKTSTGLELSAKDTPQSVSVVTKAQLDDVGATTMEDAAKTTTGVTVLNNAGKYRFQSRGHDISQIEEDSVSSTVGGGAGGVAYRDSSSMSDLVIYDHLEVVRGATGLTQGVGDVGGTINAVRKKPTTQFQTLGNFVFDRFGRARTMADVSGSLNESKTLRGRAVAMEERNPTVQKLHNHNHLIYGVVDATVGDNTVVTLGALYQSKHEQPDYYGVPLSESGDDLGFDRRTYLGYDWNRLNTQKVNVFGESETFLSDNWRWTNKINYTQSHSVSRAGSLGSIQQNFMGLSDNEKLGLPNQRANRYDNDGKQFVINTGLTGKYSLFGRQHDLFTRYIYNYQQEKSRWRAVPDRATYDPFTFVGNEKSEPDWENDRVLDVYYNSRIVSHGVMLGSRFNILDDLHLIAGSRYTNWRSFNETKYAVTRGVANGTKEYEVTKHSQFIPYVGLTYDINDNQSLYLNYASIFKPTFYQDQNNKTLDPMQGRNYEFGWKTQWFDGRLNTSASVFQIEQKNRPFYVESTSNTQAYYYIALPKIKSRGVELELSGNLTDDWRVFASYTFNKSKYAEDVSYMTSNDAAPYTPKHLVRLYTNYNLPFDEKKWTVGAGVNFQSRVSSLYSHYTDTARKAYFGGEQASYAIWNANLQYQATKNISVKLAVNNLFDKRYFKNNKAQLRGSNNFYGEPRNFVLTVDWKF